MGLNPFKNRKELQEERDAQWLYESNKFHGHKSPLTPHDHNLVTDPDAKEWRKCTLDNCFYRELK